MPGTDPAAQDPAGLRRDQAWEHRVRRTGRNGDRARTSDYEKGEEEMKRAISMAAAVAVILFLPETSRLNLVTVAAVIYGCTFYLVRSLCGIVSGVKTERERLMNLRWVRRNPPALIDLDARPEWPVLIEEPGYILFEWIGGIKDAG